MHREKRSSAAPSTTSQHLPLEEYEPRVELHNDPGAAQPELRLVVTVHVEKATTENSDDV